MRLLKPHVNFDYLFSKPQMGKLPQMKMKV